MSYDDPDRARDDGPDDPVPGRSCFRTTTSSGGAPRGWCHRIAHWCQLADRIAVLDQGKLVAEGTPDELKRLVAGGHIRLQFVDINGLESAARALSGSSRDDDALTLQVPSDGGVRSLREVLDRLDVESIEVDTLSIHTPDLDDVFFALTSHPTTQERTLR